jgi:dipeptidase E
MKLFLTSSGLRNPTLVKALLDLADLPAAELKVAFIPTAFNVESGDKGWAVDQMVRLREMGIKQLDIVDIAAVPKRTWLPRLQESNVIFVNGGNTAYLMKSFDESGLTTEIPELLKNRVYVGVSAGSYIVTPDIRFNSDNTQPQSALNLVDFGLQLHLHSPSMPYGLSKTDEAIKQHIQACAYTVYALDDEMAIKVDSQQMELVGEGKYLKFEAATLY